MKAGKANRAIYSLRDPEGHTAYTSSGHRFASTPSVTYLRPVLSFVCMHVLCGRQAKRQTYMHTRGTRYSTTYTPSLPVSTTVTADGLYETTSQGKKVAPVELVRDEESDKLDPAPSRRNDAPQYPEEPIPRMPSEDRKRVEEEDGYEYQPSGGPSVRLARYIGSLSGGPHGAVEAVNSRCRCYAFRAYAKEGEVHAHAEGEKEESGYLGFSQSPNSPTSCRYKV